MILVRYFGRDGVTDPALGSFLRDMANAIDDATSAGDDGGSATLYDLWLDHFETDLPALGRRRLEAYLESRQVWREEAGWTVYKSPDTPCIAFTAKLIGESAIELIALAACHAYPASEAVWWQRVVRPRVLELERLE